MMESYPPIKSEESGRDRYDHPAFARISQSRSQGHHVLFGSAVTHQHAIRVRIEGAYLLRDKSHDWIHSSAKKNVIELMLSPQQWGEFIASSGAGDGTPCTLISVKGEHLPRLEKDADLQNQHSNEMREALKRMTRDLRNVTKEIQRLNDEKTVPRPRLRELSARLAQVVAEFQSHIPYIQDQFAESMESTLHAMRSEIAAHVSAHAPGLKAQAVKYLGEGDWQEKVEALKLEGKKKKCRT